MRERTRIVVVEDDPSIVELLCDVLQSRGYEVMTARHACQLAELEPTNPPDLVLVDIMLPNVTGSRLAEILRRKGFAHTPMIAMSADRLLLQLAGRTGLFQDTLAKPFDVADLLARVERHAGMYVAG